jgi:hypothetical protein
MHETKKLERIEKIYFEMMQMKVDKYGMAKIFGLLEKRKKKFEKNIIKTKLYLNERKVSEEEQEMKIKD